MAENIKLAEFDIDIDALVKSAADLRKVIDQIKQSQKENARETDAQTQEYVKNEANLKALNKEYNEHIKAMTANIQATVDATNRQDLLNVALDKEVTSIAEAREQNKLLNKLRNEANATTSEGQEEIKKLNSALDANNAFIKDNSDALAQQKMNVGNYTHSIRDAFSVQGIMTNGLAGMKTALMGAAQGFGAMTKASLVFLATPIGAVIGAIGLVLGLVVNALTGTQEGMDKVTAATRPLVAVFEVFLGILQDLGLALISAFENPLETIEKIYNYVKDNVINQFEALSNVVAGIFTFDFERTKKGLDQFTEIAKEGWNDVAEAAGVFVDRIEEGVRLGKEMDELTKNLEKTQLRNAELLPQLNAQLREQNLIARDQTKTQAEREKSAVEALRLSEQINILKKEELAIELAIAENNAARNDTSREEAIAIAEIRGKMHDSDAQAAQEQVRLQSNLNTIRKDAIAQQQKAVDLQIQKQKELLDLFIAEQGERARTLSEELALEEAASERRRAILDAELKAKKISQEVYQKEILNLDAELGQKRAELAVDNALREVEANRMSLEIQRENAQFLSAQLAEQRKAENATILLQEQELARLRLETGLINQQEFDDAIRELSEINRVANKEIDDERKLIEKQEATELRAIEFEEELARLQAEGANKFEIQQAQLAEQRALELQQLDERRKQGAISEELYNARLNAITNKYSRAREKNELANEKALAAQRIDIANSMFSALSQIVDKNSGFGKALAVSQALINTFKGITSALAAPFPASIPAVALAAATGFAAVKNILKTKVPAADGGTVADGGSAAVSTASSDMQGLSGNQSNLSAVAASGNATVQQSIDDRANASGLADNVSQAVREGAAQGTAEGSEQGLTNLSDNQSIRRASTF
jgi:hypothetical protein